ncbi:MAG: class I SAM-dependent methyltransferase [Microthrixaceae bacterium]|nr:class I SAM-dependent methyltransferase [Microthrixaceae bacterium]
MSTVESFDSRGDANVSPEPTRFAVNVTKDALRQIRGGHPWVFDGSITKIKGPGGTTGAEAQPGDLAVVFDDKRKFVAVGLYDPDSVIRIRILHRGSPRAIDSEFIAEQIAAAAQVRLDSFDDSNTNGFRLVHGENDGLPGLVIDRFADVVVIKVYSNAWLRYLPWIIRAIESLASKFSTGISTVVLRAARSIDAEGYSVHDGLALLGEQPEGPVVFKENGLRFEADVVSGHKTGFFLDQRDNRRLIRSVAKGHDVLDMYSFSGGFTVSAAAGGARSVLSVDINPWAIEATERNLHLNRRINNVRHCAHEAITGDARSAMRKLTEDKRSFGVVVVDPPSFASNKNQVQGALRTYGELTRLACGLLRPGGTLFQASCSARVDPISFRQSVIESAYAAGYELSDLREMGQPVDHPVGFAQGEYLKAIIATVNRRR